MSEATSASARGPRVYLAGPDVFLREAALIGAAKKRLCQEHGCEGVFPIDTELDLSGLTKQEAGFVISKENEALIRSCEVVIANLTPFRGISADVGTVFEVGFAMGLGKKVFAYTNVAAGLLARAKAAFQERLTPAEEGMWRDEFGMFVENMDLHDNLMLEGGLHARGGGRLVVFDAPLAQRYTALEGFAQCVRQVAAEFQTGAEGGRQAR